MPTVFELGGVPIALEAPLEDRAWIAGFGGCFERGDLAHAAYRIVFEPFPGSPPEAASEARSRVAFALDGGPLRLPVVEAGGALRAWDATADAVLDVTDAGRTTRIRHGDDRLAARLLLLRVAREYAHNQALAEGDLVLHAAGLVSEGRAHAVTGAKGAGKTTRALRLMASGHRYLSNDRVRISLGAAPRAFGIPTVVTLRPGTLALFPELEAALRGAGDYRRAAGEGMEPPRQDAAGLRLSPAQLCAAFGQEPMAAAVLGSILLLEREATEASLLECLIGQASGVYASELFRSAAEPAVSVAQLRERVARLAAIVPCVSERR